LIKLATAGAKCESGSDLFHPLQTLSRKLGNPLKKHAIRLSNALKKSWKEKDILSLQHDLSETVDIDLEKEKEGALDEKIAEINPLNKEKIKLKEDNERYGQTIKNISQDVHAFNIETHQQQCSQDVENKLEAHAKILETIEEYHFPDKKKKAVPTFRKQK
jgi:hypothetical protein